MATNIGFTGTQQGMSERQKFFFRKFLGMMLRDKDGHNYFHHGDCVGADIEAAAIAHWMGYKIILHPPIITSKRAYCHFAWEERKPKDYLVRNHNIVDECSLLIACPKEMKEVLRSGTWATIRYAKKQSKSVKIIYPED
jgi:hypothetical protein